MEPSVKNDRVDVQVFTDCNIISTKRKTFLQIYTYIQPWTFILQYQYR